LCGCKFRHPKPPEGFDEYYSLKPSSIALKIYCSRFIRFLYSYSTKLNAGESSSCDRIIAISFGVNFSNIYFIFFFQSLTADAISHFNVFSVNKFVDSDTAGALANVLNDPGF